MMSEATTGLWLDPIPYVLRARAVEAFDAGDADGFPLLAGNHDGLALVAENATRLLRRGIYEKALLHAYTSTRANNVNWSTRELRWLFGLAKLSKLRAAGEPLPGNGPFTLYRGVAGKGRARRVRGFSWTSSLGQARWFAERFPSLPNRDVYRISVPAAAVMAFCDDRKESEFVVLLPPRAKPVREERRAA